MIYLELLDLRMHAYHGLYEGEEVVGSPYIVNLRVGYEDAAGPAEEPAQLIDYAALYEIIRKRMEIRQGLLEKVCEGIVGRIKHQYPFVREIHLSVYKLNPPIPHFQGRAGITITRSYPDESRKTRR